MIEVLSQIRRSYQDIQPALTGDTVWSDRILRCHISYHRLLTFFTVERGAEVLIPSSLADHPWAIEKRRVMAHVLPMAAGQLRHPISLFVLVISDDRLLHNPSALQTAIPDVARMENTSIAVPHLGRSFR